MTTIYTLELENNKYYVGRSSVPNQRILKHFQKEGSQYTKIYKPIKVLSQVKGDAFDEEKYTLIAMEKYGIDNVRGGSYCSVKLSQHDKDKALQTIRSITDLCYKCGKKGHFAKDCFNNNSNKNTENIEYELYCSNCYGCCLICCCINCDNFYENCTCNTCDKCYEFIYNNEEHKCYKCDRCCKYSLEDTCSCRLCMECHKYVTITDMSSKKCYECSK